MKQRTDDLTGQVFPPYGSFNDEDYLHQQPNDCPKIIFVMKANGTTQGQIHSTCFSDLIGGKVRFLIDEREAKTRLLATRKGVKMTMEERIRKLRPYTLQSILISELLNMRIKDGNINQNNLVLERINSSMTKDKFSAFIYALYFCSLEEDKERKHKTRKIEDFMFFTKH